MVQFINTLKGVVIAPGPTLGREMGQKRWITAFLLVVLTVFIITAVTAPARLEAGREWVKDSPIADYLDEEQLGEIQRMSGIRLVWAGLWAVFITTLGLIISTFFIYVFFGIAGAEGTYVNYFSLVSHAALIGTVFPALLGTVSLMGGVHLIRFTNLAGWLQGAHGSLSQIALSQVDLFTLWTLVAVALGVAHFARMSVRRALTVAALYFVFSAAVKSAFAYIAIRIITG